MSIFRVFQFLDMPSRFLDRACRFLDMQSRFLDRACPILLHEDFWTYVDFWKCMLNFIAWIFGHGMSIFGLC